jgi:PPOX class probable F420-dependent enzyme
MPSDPALLSLLSERKLGSLATIKRDGRPQLSNVSYHFDADQMLIRISLTADRAKVKNLRRDPRASMVVSSPDGWSYVVAEGDMTLSAVAKDPHDDAVEELIALYRNVAGKDHPDWDEYRQAMVDDQRLVGRLAVTHLYGLAR